jgi:hypothetical protein
MAFKVVCDFVSTNGRTWKFQAYKTIIEKSVLIGVKLPIYY